MKLLLPFVLGLFAASSAMAAEPTAEQLQSVIQVLRAQRDEANDRLADAIAQVGMLKKQLGAAAVKAVEDAKKPKDAAPPPTRP